MTARWTDWYWKGAGVPKAGYVPVGYVTDWDACVEEESRDWYTLKYPSGFGGGGFGGGGFGGFRPPVWVGKVLTDDE